MKFKFYSISSNKDLSALKVSGSMILSDSATVKVFLKQLQSKCLNVPSPSVRIKDLSDGE